MQTLALLVAAASLGVDYGWQPTKEGELEYIIQIAPSLVDLLKEGQEIVSEIHPDAKNVRRFRIVAGTGELPRIDLPDPEPAAELEPDPPSWPQRRPVLRGVGGVANTEFSSDLEPAKPNPPNEFSPPIRRRHGAEFRAPDAWDDSPHVGPYSLDPIDSSPGGQDAFRRNRAVGYSERLRSNNESSPEQPPAAATGGEPAAMPAKPLAEPEKPWAPLFVTVVLLFGSLGGNAYLAWLAKDFYERYRSLAAELRSPRSIET